MRTIIIFLALVHNITFSQTECIEKTKIIYKNIITSIGNSFPSPPKLNFSDKKRAVAFLSSEGITIETPIIDLLCEDENFEDKIAYIISHELAHHYLSHTWMRNTGLGYASSIGEFINEKSSSKDQRKLAESQADLFGGFFGQIAGYNVLGYAKSTLSDVYTHYNLPHEIKGYPNFSERLEIIDSKINEANSLATLFEIGNVFLKLNDFENAKKCYEDILKNDFISREIYNNLGLVYLLKGIELSDNSISKYSYPISIDLDTRAETSTTRSGDLLNSPEKLFNQATEYFEKSILLDKNYKKLIQNILVIDFITALKSNALDSFFESNEYASFDEDFQNDLKVIFELHKGRNIKKVKKKFSDRGSSVTKINLNLVPQCENSVDINKVLEIDQSELFFGLSRPNVKLNTAKGNISLISKDYDLYTIFEMDNTYLVKHKSGECFKNTTENKGFWYTKLE
jgi:tetratricopeptide (TPR) repeat protein